MASSSRKVLDAMIDLDWVGPENSDDPKIKAGREICGNKVYDSKFNEVGTRPISIRQIGIRRQPKENLHQALLLIDKDNEHGGVFKSNTTKEQYECWLYQTSRANTMETNVTTLNVQVKSLQDEVADLNSENSVLKTKIADLERRLSAVEDRDDGKH